MPGSIKIRTACGTLRCESDDIVPHRFGLQLARQRLILEYTVPKFSDLIAHHIIDVATATSAEQLRLDHDTWLAKVSIAQLTVLLSRVRDIKPSAQPCGVEEASVEVEARICRPLGVDEAQELRSLLFGAAAAKNGSRALPSQWLQGWCFEPLAAKTCPYGLRQVEGGPCGIVASVQAFLLRRLLEGSMPPVTATHQSSKQALLDAMTDVLFRLARHTDSDSMQMRVLTPANGSARVLSGLLAGPAGCSVHEFSSWGALRQAWESPELASAYFVEDPEAEDVEDRGCGVLLFLYSAMASHGVGRVREEADSVEEVSMIGAHGYCTQEVVNLLITSCASSNVFDGEKVLGDGSDQMRLRGPSSRPQVGFLSIFEAFGSLEVGQFLKNPAWPVWISHAESHYSVLFATAQEGLEKQVDVWYYDPLGRQDEEKRITVVPGGLSVEPDEDDIDDNGMIAKVIRTRWGRLAALDWNGSEPIF